MDDLHGMDVYGRIVALVYVRHNATHLLNVNKALYEAGPAKLKDFQNAFNPEAWTLYVLFPTDEAASAGIFGGVDTATAGISATVTVVLVLILLAFRGRRIP